MQRLGAVTRWLSTVLVMGTFVAVFAPGFEGASADPEFATRLALCSIGVAVLMPVGRRFFRYTEPPELLVRSDDDPDISSRRSAA